MSSTTPLIFIVGAGPGIGLAVARRFAREGFAIALIARPDENLALFEADLRAAGSPHIQCWAADINDTEALKPILHLLQAETITPKVLVYNASGGADALPSSLSQEALAVALQINVQAPLAITQAALPAMRKARRGTILFTGGGLALEPKANQAALSLGKSALRSLALSLAEELEPENIHVAILTIAGWVQPGTPFSPEALAEVFWELHQEERSGWRREVVLRA